jgi:prefoldin subunit 5
MSDLDAKKVRELEDKVRRLEETMRRLTQRVEFFERERQRIKTDINTISNVLRKQ